MNEGLREAFRHNAWATKQLLAFCRDLSDEQLTATATGTFGGIRATFNHLVVADGAYLRRLGGSGPRWVDQGDGNADLDRLDVLTGEAEQLWDRFLQAGPVDAERVLLVDDGAYGVRAGILIAQALHHGNAHREQICSIVTGLGLEPPDVQAWAYAEATGRIWARAPD